MDLPFLGERYSAVEGSGAELNGRRITVNPVSKVSEAVVAIGDYAVGEKAAQKNSERFAMTERLAAKVQRIRMHGSAAIDLAWLAAGRVDAVAMLSNKPWDTAAGVIIARAAGARIVDRDGLSHDTSVNSTVAAHPALLPTILALVSGA
ncbi:inositol monophosphatase family protein [Couchioplanes caeruleus subsp. azureus]|uniref:inositol monophosphatase family protein n=1 Tax=Couchioplanes caeruleus TaxID=56438 RepID=UPI00227D7098